MRNPVKEKLAAGGASIGTWVYINHPDVVEMLCRCGFDWLLFDMEHGAASIETVMALMQAMNGSGVTPIVRVPSYDSPAVKQALDAGAMGIMAPMINTAEQAKAFVRACKYPPQGVRGMGPRRCCDYGDTFSEYTEQANNHILVLAQIETAEAVANIDAIAAVPGVDSALMGLGDLSSDMGCFKNRDRADFQAGIDKVVASCNKAGIVPGMAYASNAEKTNAFLQRGFRMIGVSTDDEFLMKGARAILRDIKR